MTRTLTPDKLTPRVAIANYFSPEPFAAWGPRTIGDIELILIIAGAFAYDTETASLPVNAGNVLIIPPDTVHTLRRVDTSPATISCIHCELSTGMFARHHYALSPMFPTVTPIHGDAIIHDLFRQVEAAFNGFGAYRLTLAETIVKEIYLRLAERWIARSSETLSPRMQQMITFLRARLTAPVSRIDLARQFKLTPEHINALFKRELGMTPTQLVHRERVHLAYQLIRNDGLSVKQAAEHVGFYDQFYFSKIFRRIIGTPPSRLVFKRP
jgi:AraC-like DNA-binding protein